MGFQVVFWEEAAAVRVKNRFGTVYSSFPIAILATSTYIFEYFLVKPLDSSWKKKRVYSE